MTDVNYQTTMVPTDQEPGPDKESEDTQKFLAQAKKRFKHSADVESSNRMEALDDINFETGKQWPEGLEKLREIDNRPVLSINKLGQFVNSVVNENRLNRPQIKVSPVDDRGDPKAAEIFQGLIRHIEYNSNAHYAYDTALHQAVDGGFGYFRVVTDYVDDETLDQEILIRRIRNRFTVYFDPDYQEPDASDAKWCFVTEMIDKQVFRETYGEDKAANLETMAVGDRSDWATEDKYRIAEYFIVREESKEITLEGGPDDDGNPTERKREVVTRTVMRYKITANDVLEEGEWPSRWIPIIPVIGQEIDIEGKRYLHGLIRFAKDPARTYNYFQSSLVEAVAMQPKVPYIMAEGQEEGHEEQWQNANTTPRPYLLYKPVGLGDKLAPPPSRVDPVGTPMGIIEVLNQATEDLHQTTGIYPSSLGKETKQDPSGKAILARQREGDLGSYHFIDHLRWAMSHLGRILVDMIPRIFDTERIIRIIGTDDIESMVQLGVVPVADGGKAVAVGEKYDEAGKGIPIYDLSIGKYDVRISTGPSFSTRRQEAAEHMIQFSASLGEQSMYFVDLIAKNQDWPGADEIAARLHKMLPQELQDKDEAEQAEQSAEQRAAEAEGQLAQVMPQMQEMGQAIQELTKALDDKSMEQQLKRMEIELKHHAELIESQGHVEAARLHAQGEERKAAATTRKASE